MKYFDVTGQDRVIGQLKRSVESGQVSHAYIFSGDRHSGKDSVAEIFARSLVCERGGSEPCDECHACRQALALSHPDILHIQPMENKDSIGVDDIRAQINDSVVIKPFSAPRKVYIMPDAHTMTPQAQNALLKTFEEPPGYVTIILLTENMEALLPTVISRAVRRDFDSSVDPQIKTEVISLIKNIDSKDMGGILEVIGNLKDSDETPEEILDILLMWYRDVLLYKSTGRGEDLIHKDELAAIKHEAQRLSYEKLGEITERIGEAGARVRANVDFANVMEILFLFIKDK